MKTYDEGRINEFLKNYRNVAVVGVSDKADRDSYQVAQYLKSKGYNVIPINPRLECWEGIRAYPDLKSVPESAGVEIVDIFRKPEAVGEVVEEALGLNPKVIWMQESVVNEEAADRAKSKGISVVMDRCIMKEHRKIS